MDIKRISSLISIILGPATWLPVLFLAILLRSELNNHQLTILFPSILILEVLIPLAYLYFAPKLGLATTWDLPKRNERYPFLSLVFITNFISLLLVYQFGTKLFFNLSILLTTCLTIFFITTLYWQISLHTALNTFGAILINFLFGWSLSFLYLMIPIIHQLKIRINICV